MALALHHCKSRSAQPPPPPSPFPPLPPSLNPIPQLIISQSTHFSTSLRLHLLSIINQTRGVRTSSYPPPYSCSLQRQYTLPSKGDVTSPRGIALIEGSVDHCLKKPVFYILTARLLSPLFHHASSRSFVLRAAYEQNPCSR